MLGALYGDIAGSRFELGQREVERNFKLFLPGSKFTDDSLMTLAVAEALVATRSDRTNYKDVLIGCMKRIASQHPNVSWGSKFYNWLFIQRHPVPMNSYGNGAAMRIAPVGWVCETLDATIELSRLTTEISHNHPEGIKGAESVAVAIFMARTGCSKEQIKEKMIQYYPELATMTVDGIIKSGYGLDETGNWVTCQGSVPQSICAFLESNSFEDAVRKAISYGADTDTQGCITGSIAEAYYGISYDVEDKILEYFPDDLKSTYFAFDSIKKKRLKIENRH